MGSTREINRQIDECLDLVNIILHKKLLGMYLYGSSIVGGLQKYSDIDLFVISQSPTTLEEKTKLIKGLLKISAIYGSENQKPIELTIVVKSEVNPWLYPPTFDFQYGDWMRKQFESGNIEPWTSKVKPGLALQITQVTLASKTLFGPDPSQLLDKVPYPDFLAATHEELTNLMEDLSWDTRNVLLTLARIWSTLETDAIRSKSSAAKWAINKLPEEFRMVMTRAELICTGKEPDNWDELKTSVKPCADFIIDQIRKKMRLIEVSDCASKSIKLAR
jgi:streptomycin 3"-adenylyltransferase